jgi:hypothetical protein
MTRLQLETLRDLHEKGRTWVNEEKEALLAAAERALVLEDVLATAEAYVAWAHGDGESGHGTALHVAMVAAIDRAKEKP